MFKRKRAKKSAAEILEAELVQAEAELVNSIKKKQKLEAEVYELKKDISSLQADSENEKSKAGIWKIFALISAAIGAVLSLLISKSEK